MGWRQLAIKSDIPKENARRRTRFSLPFNHYDSHHRLRIHLSDFVAAYNFAKRLKTLGGLTAYEFILQVLAERTGSIYSRSYPSNAGTEHPRLAVADW